MEQRIDQINPDFTISLALAGDAEAIQRAAYLELDALGIHRGFGDAQAFWFRVQREIKD